MNIQYYTKAVITCTEDELDYIDEAVIGHDISTGSYIEIERDDLEAVLAKLPDEDPEMKQRVTDICKKVDFPKYLPTSIVFIKEDK